MLPSSGLVSSPSDLTSTVWRPGGGKTSSQKKKNKLSAEDGRQQLTSAENRRRRRSSLVWRMGGKTKTIIKNYQTLATRGAYIRSNCLLRLIAELKIVTTVQHSPYLQFNYLFFTRLPVTYLLHSSYPRT